MYTFWNRSALTLDLYICREWRSSCLWDPLHPPYIWIFYLISTDKDWCQGRSSHPWFNLFMIHIHYSIHKWKGSAISTIPVEFQVAEPDFCHSKMNFPNNFLKNQDDWINLTSNQRKFSILQSSFCGKLIIESPVAGIQYQSGNNSFLSTPSSV